MAPTQKTLRLRNLSPNTTETDLRDHLKRHVRHQGIPSVVGIGQLCNETTANRKQTVVTFSSRDAAILALQLDSDQRMLLGQEFHMDDDFLGLTTLACELNPDTGKPDIDIVTVHGLTGDGWSTFTAIDSFRTETYIIREKNWVQENLPRLLRGYRGKPVYARVMSFGYNADVWMNDSVADLDDHRNTLISSIRRERPESAKNRPVFFIGHSLGGILIKEAVVKMANEALWDSFPGTNSDATYVFPVKGCLFYGVPHQGSKLARMAVSGSYLLKPFARLLKINENNIRDLVPKSERLTRASSEFETFRDTSKLPVKSFYETHQRNPVSGVVVPKESAILDYEGMPLPLSLEKEHSDMVKFLHDHEDGLKETVDFLAELAIEILTEQSEGRRVNPERLIKILTGQEGQIGGKVENLISRLSILSLYDTVFLIDDSPSMAGKEWELVKDILDVCTAVAAHYDKDGIDIHFLNNSQQNANNVTDQRVAVQLHHEIECTGRSMLVDGISTHLSKYLKDFARSGYDDYYKRYNLIVITDGEPDDEDEDPPDQKDKTKPVFRFLQKRLVSFAKKLDAPLVSAASGHVGIQFCQIGSKQEVTDFFEFLDDRLKSAAELERDMIDTVKCVTAADLTLGFFQKLLTGAIDKWWDKQRLQDPPVAAVENAKTTESIVDVPNGSLSTEEISTSTLQTPYRSNSAHTTFSQATTAVGPSRGNTFPMTRTEPSIKETPDEDIADFGAEQSYTPAQQASPPIKQIKLRPHSSGDDTNASSSSPDPKQKKGNFITRRLTGKDRVGTSDSTKQ